MHAVQSAQKNLHNITLPAVAIEEYYDIDYLSKYYIGRTLSIANNLVKFKFLHRVLDQYVWRGRDDIEEVHMSCIFFGPIALKGPFVVANAVQHDTVQCDQVGLSFQSLLQTNEMLCYICAF